MTLSEGSPVLPLDCVGFNQPAEIALTYLPILLQKNPTHHQVHIVCGSQRVTSVPGMFTKAQEVIICGLRLHREAGGALVGRRVGGANVSTAE